MVRKKGDVDRINLLSLLHLSPCTAAGRRVMLAIQYLEDQLSKARTMEREIVEDKCSRNQRPSQTLRQIPGPTQINCTITRQTRKVTDT